MENRIGRGVITAECRSDGSSVASELFATYPCRLHLTSRPNNEVTTDRNENHSSCITCYVLGYGGGLISGDNIRLDITVKPNASLVVTSQSTSKAFKAMKGRGSTFTRTQATIGKGGLLFLVPQPMQCFGGSKLEQDTHIVLDGESTNHESVRGDENAPMMDPSLILVDWYTGGRKNMDGGLWNMNSFNTTTAISYSKQTLFPRTLSDDDDHDHDENDHDETSNNSEPNVPIEIDANNTVFRDATRLSGGKDLVNHMKRFNIVCMVVLIGPRVKQVSDLFLKKFSSRHIYDDSHFESTESESHLNHNRGEGLNADHEGLLVSCGTFNTLPGSKQCDSGVVVRLAADTLEVAASFLSKHIGTVNGQLDDDPFLEILSSRQSVLGQQMARSKNDQDESFEGKSRIPLGLIENSFNCHDDSSYSAIVEQDYVTNDKINPLILYQLVDSCVPSGGFAHSNTLEAAHQLNLLRCYNKSWKASLREHCFDVILQTFTNTVPFLVQSSTLFRDHYFQNNQSSKINKINSGVLEAPPKELICSWERIDIQLRAMMNSHVACRASTIQGSGMLRAFSSAFQNIAPVTKVLRRHIIKMSSLVQSSLQTDCCGHAATCFGAVCGLLNINNQTCVSMFLYTTARDMVNAAVRMNLIGPLEGGCVTNDLCNGINQLIESSLPSLMLHGNDTLDAAHQVTPLIEVLANAHDRLYTRLFNS